jgi:hypothetical protein
MRCHGLLRYHSMTSPHQGTYSIVQHQLLLTQYICTAITMSASNMLHQATMKERWLNPAA